MSDGKATAEAGSVEGFGPCLCGCRFKEGALKGERRPGMVRGLYWTCYTMRRAKIGKGVTTWEREVAEGRALEARGREKVVVEVVPAEENAVVVPVAGGSVI